MNIFMTINYKFLKIQLIWQLFFFKIKKITTFRKYFSSVVTVNVDIIMQGKTMLYM